MQSFCVRKRKKECNCYIKPSKLRHKVRYIARQGGTFLFRVQNQPFADVLQNKSFENFAKILGKHLCWSLFLVKLQVALATLLKMHFGAIVF